MEASLWTRCMGALETELPEQQFNTWVRPLQAMEGNGALKLLAPNRFVVDWINANLLPRIGELLRDESTGDVPIVTVEVGSRSAAARAVPAAALPGRVRRAEGLVVGARLNPDFSFTTFVEGKSNQLAKAAAAQVAENPGRAYNPLFLYGGTGMGKTHLMQAIGHEIKRRTPQSAICYVSSEKFTNEMINSLRYDKMISFRDKFRTVDVLLVDDIQFLAQKERTQEEFFHTFNALHELMKQIVIASDRPPKELAEFEDRLRSRFEWGLIADIQPPDLETKVAILQKKAEQERVTLPTDVALFIATNIRSNVRELEGALIRLVAHSSLIGAEITLPYTQQVLKNFIDSQARKVTIESIQKAVAEQFGLRLVEIKAKNNSRSIVYPRQIAMYLAKHLTEASLPEIGRQFGGKHHTTVLHSVDKIEGVRKNDKDLNRLLNKLTEQLGA